MHTLFLRIILLFCYKETPLQVFTKQLVCGNSIKFYGFIIEVTIVSLLMYWCFVAKPAFSWTGCSNTLEKTFCLVWQRQWKSLHCCRSYNDRYWKKTISTSCHIFWKLTKQKRPENAFFGQLKLCLFEMVHTDWMVFGQVVQNIILFCVMYVLFVIDVCLYMKKIIFDKSLWNFYSIYILLNVNTIVRIGSLPLHCYLRLGWGGPRLFRERSFCPRKNDFHLVRANPLPESKLKYFPLDP